MVLQEPGGLVAILNFPMYWESHHPNWLSYIFQRGGPTTNHYRYAPFQVPYNWLPEGFNMFFHDYLALFFSDTKRSTFEISGGLRPALHSWPSVSGSCTWHAIAPGSTKVMYCWRRCTDGGTSHEMREMVIPNGSVGFNKVWISWINTWTLAGDGSHTSTLFWVILHVSCANHFMRIWSWTIPSPTVVGSTRYGHGFVWTCCAQNLVWWFIIIFLSTLPSGGGRRFSIKPRVF